MHNPILKSGGDQQGNYNYPVDPDALGQMNDTMYSRGMYDFAMYDPVEYQNQVEAYNKYNQQYAKQQAAPSSHVPQDNENVYPVQNNYNYNYNNNGCNHLNYTWRDEDSLCQQCAYGFCSIFSLIAIISAFLIIIVACALIAAGSQNGGGGGGGGSDCNCNGCICFGASNAGSGNDCDCCGEMPKQQVKRCSDCGSKLESKRTGSLEKVIIMGTIGFFALVISIVILCAAAKN